MRAASWPAGRRISIRQALGTAAIVAIQQSGTVIALLPGDREAAEQTVHGLCAAWKPPLSRCNGRGLGRRSASPAA